MDVNIMVEHYKKLLKNPKDVLDFIEHDLKHMGLGQEEINKHLATAKEILGV